MEGWIKLHRTINKHWIFKDSEKLKAWITILLNVNHEKNKVNLGNLILTCNRGESLKSLDSWAKLFGKNWNKSKVRRFFKLLKNDLMIELKNEQKTTRLIVCKYDTYQETRNASETQTKRKRNASETQTTPNKNDNNVKEIIAYLNKNANKNFRYKTEKTKTVINSRLNEGFKISDFKIVIDTKIKQWLSDTKMNEFLRPETLFGSKFESYLNVNNLTTIPKEGVLDRAARITAERQNRK